MRISGFRSEGLKIVNLGKIILDKLDGGGTITVVYYAFDGRKGDENLISILFSSQITMFWSNAEEVCGDLHRWFLPILKDLYIFKLNKALLSGIIFLGGMGR